MKISVVTISFNSKDTIEGTILSVLAQKNCNLEYIVVDGNSSDGTREILEKYRDRINHLIIERDSGIYDAMNKGIARATGDVIGVLNSDDLYAHDEVLANVSSMMSSGDCDALYGDLDYVHHTQTDKLIRHWTSGRYRRSRWLRGWMPPHPAFFLKRKCYEEYGTYRTDFTISADYELMLRMMFKYRVTACYLPDVLVKMRTGGASNSSLKQRLKANKEDRMAWKVNGYSPGPITTVLKPLRKVGQWLIR